MRMVPLALAVFVLVGCSQAGREEDGRPESDVASASKIDAIVESGPELDAAFRAVFGSAAPATWVPGEDWEALEFTPNQLIRIGETYYLLSDGQGSECHICGGALVVTRLSRSGNAFTVQGDRTVVRGSGWGMPPEVQTRTDLLAGPALLAQTGGGAMGCGVNGVALFELTPSGVKSRVENIPVHHSFEDFGIGETNGEIVPGRPGESFDVRYTGAQTLTVQYRRSGEIYEPSQDLSESMMC